MHTSQWSITPNNAHQLTPVNAHCTIIGESLHNLSHCTPLLTNGNVDTVQLLLCGWWEEVRVSMQSRISVWIQLQLTFIFSFIESLLVDDGVNGNGSLTAQTDKKTLALTAHPFCSYVLHHNELLTQSVCLR